MNYWLLLGARARRRRYLRCLARVDAFIELNPGADLQVSALAGVAHLPKRTFARVYRELRGVTPAKAVERARIEHAMRILWPRWEGPGLERVANELGFGCWMSFRRAFKRVTGLPPDQWIELRAARVWGWPGGVEMAEMSVEEAGELARERILAVGQRIDEIRTLLEQGLARLEERALAKLDRIDLRLDRLEGRLDRVERVMDRLETRFTI